MEDNKKKIIKRVVAAGSAAALAFLTYKVYKSYKKELERQRELFEEQKELEELLLKKEIDGENDKHNRFIEEEYSEEEEVVDDSLSYYNPIYERDISEEHYTRPEHYGETLMSTSEEEGEETLRHNPDSFEAFEQYRDMKLAEVRDEEIRETLMRLWDIPFKPTTGEDERLLRTLMYDRVEFFGEESVWVERIPFGEVIINFSELAKFDIDIPMERTVKAWLYHLGLKSTTGQYSMEKIVEAATHHNILTPDDDETMFGLDTEQMDDMYTHVQTEDDISFMKEYNTWLYWQMKGVE